MLRVQVDYRVDGTMATDVRYIDGPVSYKIQRSGRGYVKTAEMRVAYRRIERITVTEAAAGGDERDMS